ncbi:MAG: hypothetical protein K6A63_08390 [Acholeplasmatales bacterium]|nr:hypothetical protein [Acholeplasmatales bacterium]
MNEKIKLYENFCKLNKLDISSESAKEFTELIDEPNYDADILSEEYVDYAKDLRTKKARLNNYTKAYKISNRNVIAKVLMYESARNDANNTVNLKLVPNSKYPGKDTISFLDFLNDAIDDQRKYIIDKDLYDPLEERDVFTLDYECKRYLWLIKKLYVNYVELWKLDEATRIGEELLSLNPGDNLDILDSLPYLYIANKQYSEARILLNHKKLDKGQFYLIKAFLDLVEKKEEDSLNSLLELKKLNSHIINMIVTSYNPKNLSNLVTEQNDYSYAAYIYVNSILMGEKEMDLIKKLIIAHYELFEY